MIDADELHNGAVTCNQLSNREPSRVVSAAWLADYWSVNIATVYRDIRKGALPASRLPGGQLRILLSDAMNYGRPIE